MGGCQYVCCVVLGPLLLPTRWSAVKDEFSAPAAEVMELLTKLYLIQLGAKQVERLGVRWAVISEARVEVLKLLVKLLQEILLLVRLQGGQAAGLEVGQAMV